MNEIFEDDEQQVVVIPCCKLCRKDIEFYEKEIERMRNENQDTVHLEEFMNIWTLNTMYPVNEYLN